MDSIKSAMYNNAYMIRTAMSDMMEGNMFPKGVEGPIRLIGNQEFSSEEEPEFLSSLAAFTWFSYRQGFTGIPDISYDTGWGCVHRAGQMLLMIALTRHLGCDRAKLLSHFRDVPSASFSIQAIATHGRTYGKQPGQWFAPSTIAHVIKDLLAEQVDRGFLQAAPLRTVVVTDQQVKCKQVLSQAASSGILMLIPFMFGIDTVNASNERLLLSILHSRYCVGILGGRPRHALYFIGSRANHLIYLDPHRVQPAFTEQANIGVLEEPKRRSVCTTDIDPCSLIAFYTRDTRETAVCVGWWEKALFLCVTPQQKAM
eukprot:TRINITY_DN8347_c0_g1_i1.p1 TRINITY_DN8347_c0_g1~~TRINITY_DN8347_c0_g1_i1.p1  ORF type:complete len:335 (+),score=60.21 TRINITY_DN8347_c0_g1_i1:64-1005(+)